MPTPSTSCSGCSDVYFDSQVTVGLLSNVTASLFTPDDGPPRPPKNISESLRGELLTAEQTAAVRNYVNRIAGSKRLLAHGLMYTGVGNADYIQFQIDEYQPDSWKGYCISNAAKVDTDPESLMRQWRLDDEQVAYPTYEVISRNYRRQRRRSIRASTTSACTRASRPTPSRCPNSAIPSDIPKAAADWPNLNFVIYHSCIKPAFFDYNALADIRSGRLREGVPDIAWTTEFAVLAQPFRNVYAEIGTTFASSVVTFPTVTAHILGQLLKFLGPDRILFGSDSPWYGSPQWQIDALWRFEIPRWMQRQYGYPPLTKQVKRKILGLNGAAIYGLQPGRRAGVALRHVQAGARQLRSADERELQGGHGVLGHGPAGADAVGVPRRAACAAATRVTAGCWGSSARGAHRGARRERDRRRPRCWRVAHGAFPPR